MSTIPSKKANIKSIIKKVNRDRAPIIIVDENGISAVVLSMDDFESMNETIYLLSSKANARWLYDSTKEMEEGKFKTFTFEELENEYQIHK
ncbi:type II toxin-antitoxin system Phd/YefM family antitoxin [Mesoaciditoga sp.]